MTTGAGPPVVGASYRRVEATLLVALLAAHLIGAAITVVLLVVVLPSPSDADGVFTLVNALLLVGYLAVVVPVIVASSLRWSAPLRRDARHGSLGPLARERLLALPSRLVVLYAIGWGGGALIFGALEVRDSVLGALQVGFTVVLAGASTSAMAYLLTELILRPVLPLALAGEAPGRRRAGVGVRFVLTWVLGTGISLAGIVFASALALVTEPSADRVAATAVVLGVIGLAVGFAATIAMARSVSLPLRRVRQVLAAVEGGDLDVAVDVDDASEIGELQAGVNAMVAGLRERERLRDLFGRHVGHDVAEQALRDGAELVGEERDVGVLFVDVIGSTTLAATRAPGEVVALLNEFFAVVVAAADEHGGWVNKFEGDGALCVFGAPSSMEDPAGAALEAARALRDRLAAELPSVRAGIGVAAGPVVAGNVGARDRFEYTVIGDPVNEAARLTELAKDEPGLLLASDRAVAMAGPAVAARWHVGEPVVLRGRTDATRTATPV